jgi:hypothetical protein
MKRQSQLLCGNEDLKENKETGWTNICKYIPDCTVHWCEDIRIIPKGAFLTLNTRQPALTPCRSNSNPLHPRPRILRRPPHPRFPKRPRIPHPRLLDNHHTHRPYNPQDRTADAPKPMARTRRIAHTPARYADILFLSTQRPSRLRTHSLQNANPALTLPPANLPPLQSARSNRRRNHRNLARIHILHLRLRHPHRRLQQPNSSPQPTPHQLITYKHKRHRNALHQTRTLRRSPDPRLRPLRHHPRQHTPRNPVPLACIPLRHSGTCRSLSRRGFPGARRRRTCCFRGRRSARAGRTGVFSVDNGHTAAGGAVN